MRMKRVVFLTLAATVAFTGCARTNEEPEPSVSTSVENTATADTMPYDEGEILWEDVADQFLNANTTYSDVKETATIQTEENGMEPVNATAVTVYDNRDPNITVYSSTLDENGLKKELVVVGEEAKSNTGDGWVNDNSMFYTYLIGPANLSKMLYENAAVDRVVYEGYDEGLHKFVFNVDLVKAGIQYYAEEGQVAEGTYTVWLNDRYMMEKLVVAADDENFGTVKHEYVYSDYNSGIKVSLPE